MRNRVVAESEAAGSSASGRDRHRRAAQPQSKQEHGQDDGERIDRPAQHEATAAGSRRPRRPARIRPDMAIVAGIERCRRAGGGPTADFGSDTTGGMRGEPASIEARDQGDEAVEGRGHERGRRHVVDAQEIEAGGKAPDDRADRVAAVEESQPGDARRGGFDPARDGGQGRRP